MTEGVAGVLEATKSIEYEAMDEGSNGDTPSMAEDINKEQGMAQTLLKLSKAGGRGKKNFAMKFVRLNYTTARLLQNRYDKTCSGKG